MKTDALIDLLATGSGPVPRHALPRRFAAAVAIGATGALVLLLAIFGVNPALRDFIELPNFWIKMSFTVALACAGLVASQRLARPGVTVGHGIWLVLLPVLALWLLSLVLLATAEPTTRMYLVLGNTWSKCPINIVLLSTPVFLAGLWALRGLAPTEHRFAGAALGLFSGAIGACVYGLHCPELAPPFLAVWYLLGILVPCAIGFVAGPRLLRW